jgi:multiple antibiotic resistance protein
VTVTVFAVLASAALFGERLLRLMGASLPAFQVGGGLVLLLMALAMLNAQAGEIRQTRAEAEEAAEYSGVVPLAVPLLAGPGAISTTIIAAQDAGVAHIALLVVCIALVCALLWVTLRLAQRIGARMGKTGLNIATRLLGLLLAAIAIQTMAEGLRVLFPGLAA